MTKLTCEAIARAVLGEPVKRGGAEALYRCPHPERHANGDAHPSFKVNAKKNAWGCFVCGIGGTPWQLAAFLAGLDPSDKVGVTAWLREHGQLNGASGNNSRRSTSEQRRVAEFYYTPGLRKVRIEPARDGSSKEFVWEHRTSDSWERCHGCKHEKPLYTNRIFRERDQLGVVLALEGEAKPELAGELGFAAISFKELQPEHCVQLAGLDIVLWPDKDTSGEKQCSDAAKILHDSKQPRLIRMITPPPELPVGGDILDAVRTLGLGPAEIETLIGNAPEWKPAAQPTSGFTSAGNGNRVNPWPLASGMDTFLSGDEDPVTFLLEPIISKGAISEIFSPRGLGKSLWALAVAVSLASKGHRVLLIDRDNPRREVRSRLLGFGATRELGELKVLSREHAPPLTNKAAWAEFPYAEYDFVVLDSFDSAAEGVGEQDSTKPSLAIAPLLDIARRENGPAVLVLGNTVKSAKHSRGSGVIEDRADIVFEVRDATNLHPTGEKPWIEELPEADAGSWVGRSTRRKRLSKYRLAFIATKFRIGEEPEPFIIEIDLTTEPWTVRDVTNEVDREGAAARTRDAEERAAAIRTNTKLLKVEILRREASGDPIMLKKQAEDFLVSRRNTRKAAREVINSPAFEIVPLTGKGHPNGVRVACKNDDRGGNGSPTKAAPNEGSSNGDFGRPHPEHSAEMPPNKTRYPCGSQSSPISAEPTLFTDPDGTETASAEPLDDPDDEVAL
jgi:hypothetical protein